MMKILWAVIVDLYQFAIGILGLPSRNLNQKLLPAHTQDFKKTNATNTNIESTNFKKDHDILSHTGTVGFISVDSANVFLRPVWAVDTVIARLFLGEEVQIQNYQGRFVRVETEKSTGWVLKDEVTINKRQVWPDLVSGDIYDSNNVVTNSIRAIIKDEFFTVELYLPLQPTEYLTYRLLKENITLPWPKTRPRSIGLWHEILKGQLGVISGLEAKTGAIMEGIMDNDEPFLAYVEAVHIDGTIEISAVGRHVEGEFKREILNKDEALILRPVYIQRN